MIYIEVAEKSKKEAIYMTILSTLAANAAMFACEINFNDAEAHAGTSFVPFLGFMVFLIGLVFCFIGIVKINDAKKQWYLFYDNRDKDDRKQPKYAKEKKTGILFVVIGVVCMIASFIIMR